MAIVAFRGDVAAGEALFLRTQFVRRQLVEKRLSPLAEPVNALLDAVGKRVQHVFAGQRLIDLAHPIADARHQMVHLAERDIA